MAHLRLLAVAFALVFTVSTLSCSQCYGSRKVEVPRLAGQILDERTGKPIEGMTVYQVYSTFNKLIVGAAHEGGGERDERWTTTDAEGRFEFPAHVVAEALKNYVRISSEPGILLLHREYGRPLVYVTEDRAQWEKIVWKVKPDPVTLGYLADSVNCSRVCDLQDRAYEHCYELACQRPIPEGRKPRGN